MAVEWAWSVRSCGSKREKEWSEFESRRRCVCRPRCTCRLVNREALGHLWRRTEHPMHIHVSAWASLYQLPPHSQTLGFSDSKRLYLILLCLYPFYLLFTKYSLMGGRGRKQCVEQKLKYARALVALGQKNKTLNLLSILRPSQDVLCSCSFPSHKRVGGAGN